jgi:two-component system chemotaxis response regulator CheB
MMIKVLIADDSASVRLFLSQLLSADPDVEVVGTAGDGEEVLEAVARLRPDVVTMDVHMPRMNGLIATRRIMETHPTPIVIVSGNLDSEEVATTFHALDAGAVAALPRPHGAGHPDHEREAKSFVQTVKLMSEVKLVRRWTRPAEAPLLQSVPRPSEAQAEIGVVAIGASTGGPQVIHSILAGLPRDFPVPILIVQHMASGFLEGFVTWLSGTSGVLPCLPVDGESLLPGRAYIAPDGCHMEVTVDRTIALRRTPPENGLRPSVAALFRSVARVYGGKTVGVLLTGMGTDGAPELRLMKEQGAVTIVQDQESSVVHGMPGEALKLGAAMYTIPPETIVAVLKRLTMGK